MFSEGVGYEIFPPFTNCEMFIGFYGEVSKQIRIDIKISEN